MDGGRGKGEVTYEHTRDAVRSLDQEKGGAKAQFYPPTNRTQSVSPFAGTRYHQVSSNSSR